MLRRLLLSATALGAALGLAGCAAAAPSPAASEGSGPLVAFYGDSYTLGTGASDPAKRWSTVICRERGWREYNPSVNGLGFVNHRTAFGEGSGDLPSLVLAKKPDILFITMGLNDNFSYDADPDRIRAQITADSTRISEGLPDARIVVVEPFWYTDERPASVATIIGWVKDAAAAIGADYIPDASHWIEGHPEWMANDGLHPNDDGYAEMARKMDDALRHLDPPL
ncbi:SGNH/GDSL hydrolase family protein [Naasia aerilata]|uniref:SGNH hydrolase-type esterase domain-containing protein n=1 Tax=Naasia aerilata TaxID=1162966 RepID=A0ABN6XRC1_9MICO|nr:SGNH/GDSL hydrolase family protein [Naasia aerilata]BDZ45968.1 hypothetical protein GCM10025866_18770 [Naasia aerilata]